MKDGRKLSGGNQLALIRTSSFSMLNTPVDALSTLYVMGLEEAFQQAKALVLNLNLDIVSCGVRSAAVI